MTSISNRDAADGTGGAGAAMLEIEESVTSKHPDLHRLLAYYQERRRTDGLLPRAVVAPRDLTELLPSLCIAEPTAGGDWRFRLIGTGLVERFGREFTGRTVRAVYEQKSARTVVDIYDRVARGRHAIMCRGRFLGLGIDYLRCESVQVPLLGADGRTVMIFGGVFFF
jgi:hypothetical protein